MVGRAAILLGIFLSSLLASACVVNRSGGSSSYNTSAAQSDSAYMSSSPETVFSAVVSVLTEQGYVIMAAEREAGVVSGTQNAPVNAFAGTLSGASGMVKQVSVTVRPEGSGSRVKAVFNISLVKKYGKLSPLSSSSATTVSNRQKFFSALRATVN